NGPKGKDGPICYPVFSSDPVPSGQSQSIVVLAKPTIPRPSLASERASERGKREAIDMGPEWVRSSVRSFGIGVALALVCADAALAQTGNLAIDWEVANRFRLFAVQADFDAQVTAFRAIRSKSVLDLEQELAKGRGGVGWAANVHRLCYDES